jgi:hypothetical protein
MLKLFSKKRWLLGFLTIMVIVGFIILQGIPLKGAVDPQSFSEIKAVNPFPPEIGGIKKGMQVSGEYLFYCDIKMPVGMTEEITGRLISLDACGKELAQPQDIIIPANGTTPQRVYKFAPVFQDIPLVPASEQPDPQRYTLYRTPKTIMALDCILEEGKVPSDYNVIVHHIDPIGKIRFELVTNIPAGTPAKKNPSAPAMERDIAGIRVNGSMPSFSILCATRPRFTVVFPDNIQPGTLEVVRDDGDDATADEVEIPTNLFMIHGNKAETPVVRPELEVPAGIYRIVATATSDDGTLMRLESNIIIYSSEKYAYFLQSPLMTTVLVPVGTGTSWVDMYAKNRILLAFDTFLSDFPISKILRTHCVKPVGLERSSGIICGRIEGERDNFEVADVIFENDTFNVSEIPGVFDYDPETGIFNYLLVSTKLAESINLSAFVDFPPTPQFKPIVGIFSVTLSPSQQVEFPLPRAIHNVKGDIAVQDVTNGNWYDEKELKQVTIVREEERAGKIVTIFDFTQLDGKHATPLSGIDLTFIYLHNTLPHWDDPALALVARQMLKDCYDISILGTIEDIKESIETRDWPGIGICVAAYAIPGFAGKAIKKVSRSVKKAVLMKRYKGRISGALKKRFGKETIEDLTEQELDHWFKECAEKFPSGLPREVCEDIGYQGMQLSALKKKWKGFTIEGRRWHKKYHGFNDLRVDAQGNIIVCEAKAGAGTTGSLDIFKNKTWGNKPARDVTQMDPDWVRQKIDEMLQGDDFDKQVANHLLEKWRQGKLKGMVFYTPIKMQVVEKTWTKPLIDYGTQPPW